jgi:hypothetical protein
MTAPGCHQLCKAPLHTASSIPIQLKAKMQSQSTKYSSVSVLESQIERENAREIIFVKKNIEVGRFARAEQTRVAIEIEVKFNRADNI